VVFGSLTTWVPSAFAQTYVFGEADFATGASPDALVAGDLNADGKLDLATANSGDNTVSVLIGKPEPRPTLADRAERRVRTAPSQ
jgi:hypothetical protein